jgi:2'-5' RNA ligase
MRLFVAVPVDDKIRAVAAEVARSLASVDADVRWVSPETMHLTLSFIGEIDETRVPDISRAVASTVRAYSSFEIVFDRIGAFGAPSRPKIIWLGIGTGAKVLTATASDLRARLPPADDENEFNAHLTIGRVKGPRNIEKLVEALKTTAVFAAPLRVDRLVLYRSTLGPAGPKHEALFEARLRE